MNLFDLPRPLGVWVCAAAACWLLAAGTFLMGVREGMNVCRYCGSERRMNAWWGGTALALLGMLVCAGGIMAGPPPFK